MTEAVTENLNFQLHEKDTGSADIQVAQLTSRINHLTAHLSKHRKDFSTRRGLLKLVARRRKLLDYLKNKNVERYQKVIKGLNLRRVSPGNNYISKFSIQDKYLRGLELAK